MDDRDRVRALEGIADRVQADRVAGASLGDAAERRGNGQPGVESLTAAPDTSNSPGELYCTACEKAFQIGERCPVDGTRLIKLKTRIDPFLGRDLDGRYTVLEKLGAGGMGAVYRAEQHSVDREVAIKVVHSSLVSEPEVIKRFLREAKLASRLSHPNAVGVLDFGQTEDGVFYLVMELVTGRTLDEAIKAERQLRPERVVRIAIQISTCGIARWPRGPRWPT